MAESEILGMVNSGWLTGIKASDPHPVIKAFVIGHEGESDIVLGGRKVGVQWLRNAVGWIHDKLQMFIPVYEGHGAPGDNSPQGRVPVGQIVGKALMNVGNKVAAVAAMYFFPNARDRVFDVASIEADITFEQDESSVRPTGVETISGVAVSNSTVSKPGFPGATLLGAVQAFTAKEGVQAMALTLAELKAAAKEIAAKPSDLFPVDDIMSDAHVAAKVREDKSNVYNQSQRLQAELDEARNRLVQATEKYEGMLREERTKVVLSRKETIAETVMKERKLSDNEAAFARLQLKRFNTNAADEDALKQGINKFLDEVQADYAEVAKIHGVKVDQAAGDANKGDGGGSGTGDKGAGDAGASGQVPGNAEPDVVEAPFLAYANPDTNPLIAGGKADKEFSQRGA